MWLDSEVGTGQHLPLHRARWRSPIADAAAAAAARPSTCTDLRVLVVDDNATNRRILHEVLRNWRMKPDAVGRAAPTASLRSGRRARPAGRSRWSSSTARCRRWTASCSPARPADRQLRATPMVMLTSAALPDDRAAVPQARDRRPPDEAGQAVGSARTIVVGVRRPAARAAADTPSTRSIARPRSRCGFWWPRTTTSTVSSSRACSRSAGTRSRPPSTAGRRSTRSRPARDTSTSCSWTCRCRRWTVCRRPC